MKTIDTLVKDIEGTILGLNGWDEALGTQMGSAIAETASARFSKPQEPRGYLSLSGMGDSCDRSLWYKVNKPEWGETLPANVLFKFFYGDMIEEVVLRLAEISGHKVEGEQDRVYVHGIKGHRDAVIDGMLVDAKSCSPFAFQKFKKGGLREDDPFGYISQLSSYLYAAKDDPLVTNKTHAGFLAIDKVNGSIHLDVYDFTEELKTKGDEVAAKKEAVAGEMPEKGEEPVPQSKTSPNMKLSTKCSYCGFKKACWPTARKFVYSSGPTWLTTVSTVPKVFEEEDWTQ